MAKYEKWLNEDRLTLIEGWARDGASDEQIAKMIGISRSTLAKWRKTYPEIEKAVSAEKEIADYKVENALFKKALDGDVPAMKFWLECRNRKKWGNAKDSIAQSENEIETGIIVLPEVKKI